ncbi:MAG: non-canonical purine NTP pyrophosphatase [Nanoarchaeota archaeon]
MSTYFITGNQEKFNEVKRIIPGIEQLELDLVEIQSDSHEEIVRHKIDEALRQRPDLKDRIFFVEDTGFHMRALGGLPGPLIKWFVKDLGLDGLADLADKMGDDCAWAVAIFGLYDEGSISFHEGRVDGRIVPKGGDPRFQWDQIFIPQGYARRFSEMSMEEKNAISHRFLAADALRKHLSR